MRIFVTKKENKQFKMGEISETNDTTQIPNRNEDLNKIKCKCQFYFFFLT
jgi:hypothetical protein